MSKARHASITDEAFWKSVWKNIDKRANEFSSRDLTHLMQAIAHADHTSTGSAAFTITASTYAASKHQPFHSAGGDFISCDKFVDEIVVTKLMRKIAQNISKYNDEQLVRLFYCCFRRHQILTKRKKFVEFLSSEVTERLTKIKAWRLHRILMSAFAASSGRSDTSFLTSVAKQIVSYSNNLEVSRIAELVPMIELLGLSNRDDQVRRLNTTAKKKMFKCAEAHTGLLDLGLAFLLPGLMQGSTLRVWLQRLEASHVDQNFGF